MTSALWHCSIWTARSAPLPSIPRNPCACRAVRCCPARLPSRCCRSRTWAAILPICILPARIEDVVISLGHCRNCRCFPPAPRWDGTPMSRIRGSLAACSGVRYALSGNVDRGGDGVRIAAELRETEEGDVIWSDRIDAADNELFDVQVEIVARVVAGTFRACEPPNYGAHSGSRPDSLTVYDYTLAGCSISTGCGARPLPRRDRCCGVPCTRIPVTRCPSPGPRSGTASGSARPGAIRPQRMPHLGGRSPRVNPARSEERPGLRHRRTSSCLSPGDPAGALPLFDSALVGRRQAMPCLLTLRSGSLSYLGRGAEALDSAPARLPTCRRTVRSATTSNASSVSRTMSAATRRKRRAG